MTCSHCEAAVSAELGTVPGVVGVEIDLESKAVVVRGNTLDDEALGAAIAAVGYEAERVP